MRTAIERAGRGCALAAALCGCKPEEPEPEDIVLTEAMRPATGEVVDCNGGTIRPADPWEEGQEPPPTNRAEELTWQVAILVDGAEDVEIRNCVIEGFAVGILSIDGSGLVLADNTIDVRWLPLELETSPDTVITGNDIRGAYGIIVNRRSHRTRVANNRFEQAYPDGQHMLLTFDGPATVQAVDLYIVDGDLLQVPNEAGNLEDVVIEDNEFVVGPDGIGIYNAVRSKNTVVRGNTVSGGQTGIHLPGFPAGMPTALPGTCSGDAGRYCAYDEDCFIEGFDEASLGTCTFPGELTCWVSGATCTGECEGDDLCGYHVPTSLVVDSSLVTSNTVTGSCLAVGAYWAVDASIEDNVLTGPTDDSACDFTGGIFLGTHPFESARVTGNTASGFGAGLYLYQGHATAFGAQVSRNDFSGNEIGWWAAAEDPDTLEPIPMIPAELSVDGEGNYWGLTCDQGVDGFPEYSFCVGGDNHQAPCNGAGDCPAGECVPPTVTDSHAFGAPVTDTSTPCPS